MGVQASISIGHGCSDRGTCQHSSLGSAQAVPVRLHGLSQACLQPDSSASAAPAAAS